LQVRAIAQARVRTGGPALLGRASSEADQERGSPQKLVSYFGLNPRVRQSAHGAAHHGRISKIGFSDARAMLVEAAWAAALAIQTIAVEIQIPNRAAANSADIPPADAARTRWRRSSLKLGPYSLRQTKDRRRESQGILTPIPLSTAF